MGHLNGYTKAVVLVYLLHRAGPWAAHFCALGCGYVYAPVRHPLIQRAGVDKLIHRKAPLQLALHGSGYLFPLRRGGCFWRWGRLGSYIRHRRGRRRGGG